jgi:hypothetical protein
MPLTPGDGRSYRSVRAQGASSRELTGPASTPVVPNDGLTVLGPVLVGCERSKVGVKGHEGPGGGAG